MLSHNKNSELKVTIGNMKAPVPNARRHELNQHHTKQFS